MTEGALAPPPSQLVWLSGVHRLEGTQDYVVVRVEVAVTTEDLRAAAATGRHCLGWRQGRANLWERGVVVAEVGGAESVLA